MPTPPAPEPRRRKAGWITLAITLMIVAGAVGEWYRTATSSTALRAPEPPRAALSDTAARAPSGARVRVRVLNTTTTRGLAKRVTFVLRDFGYDVVDFDSDPRTRRSSTLILAHSAHADWAQRLRRALGTGTIEVRADSLRHVDFTVLVGSDWKAPAQPFRP